MRDRIYDLTVSTGAALVSRLEALFARSSLVGNPTFFDHDAFPWVGRIEGGWEAIRRELDQVLHHYGDGLPNFQDMSKFQKDLSNDDAWKTFFFYAYGYKCEPNCERCPETTRLLESIPGMKTGFFSILAPGKHIPAHRGPFKGVIRYHLGLLVPEPRERCRIRVGDEYASWEEGGSLIFDDTYEHEVWNDTDGLRVVLFVDFVRPLKLPARALNAALLNLIRWSPFVQDGVQNYKQWEAKFDQVSARQGNT